jgi:hypothetical protein
MFFNLDNNVGPTSQADGHIRVLSDVLFAYLLSGLVVVNKSRKFQLQSFLLQKILACSARSLLSSVPSDGPAAAHQRLLAVTTKQLARRALWLIPVVCSSMHYKCVMINRLNYFLFSCFLLIFLFINITFSFKNHLLIYLLFIYLLI